MRKNILCTLLMLAPFSAFCNPEYDGYEYGSEDPDPSFYTPEHYPSPQTLDLFTTPTNVSKRTQPNSARNPSASNPIINRLFSQIVTRSLFRSFARSNKTINWEHYPDKNKNNKKSPQKKSKPSQIKDFFYNIRTENQKQLNTLFTKIIPYAVLNGQINTAVLSLVNGLAPIIKTLPQHHPLAQLLIDPWETCILLSRKPGFGAQSAETFLPRLQKHLEESALYQVFTMDENRFKELDNAVQKEDLSEAIETLSGIFSKTPASSTSQNLNPLNTLIQTMLSDPDIAKNWNSMGDLFGQILNLLSKDSFKTRASQNLVPVVWACMAILNQIKRPEIVDPVFPPKQPPSSSQRSSRQTPYQPSNYPVPWQTDPAYQMTGPINQNVNRTARNISNNVQYTANKISETAYNAAHFIENKTQQAAHMAELANHFIKQGHQFIKETPEELNQIINPYYYGNDSKNSYR